LQASESVQKVRRYLDGEGDLVRERVDELVVGLSAPEVVETLLEATAHLGGEARGNLIVDALPDPADADPEVLEAARETAEDRYLDGAARIVLLDYLAAAAREAEPAGYRETVRGIAAAQAQPSIVRARALRLLADDTGPGVEGVLQTALRSGDDAVVAAAAATVADRAQRGEPVPDELVEPILERASLRLPGTLRALAELGSAPARDALERLASEAREPLELVGVLNAAGPQLDQRSVALLVERSVGTGDPAAAAAVTAVFAAGSADLDALARGGHETAYLAALALAPELADDRAVARCSALARSDDPEVAASARAVAWQLPEADVLAEFQTRVTFPDGDTRDVDELFETIRSGAG
jgi:hypothetical protein